MEDSSCKTPRWRMLKSLLNNLSPQDFKKKMQSDEEVVIIDVRTANEFEQNAFKNALNINFLKPDFWEKLDALDKSKTYLVYCRTGRRSIRACTLMSNGGFDKTKVFNLDGGIVTWAEVFR